MAGEIALKAKKEFPNTLIAGGLPPQNFTYQADDRTEAEIEAYKKEHSNSEWMIETLPITQEMSDRYDEKYGDNNWYDWANNNWGVKWDACDITAEEAFGDTEITYWFDTPWGPPQEIYMLLVAKFPNVSIQWFWDEPGCQQAGYLPFKEV